MLGNNRKSPQLLWPIDCEAPSVEAKDAAFLIVPQAN